MKRILIVGATSGIGEGLARLYAERGEVKIGVMEIPPVSASCLSCLKQRCVM